VYLSLWMLLVWHNAIRVREFEEVRCACGYDCTGLTGERCPECGGAGTYSVRSRTRRAKKRSAKVRLAILALLLVVLAPGAFLLWSFTPLRWQVSWPEASKYLVVWHTQNMPTRTMNP
jgi:hypothetical protein